MSPLRIPNLYCWNSVNRVEGLYMFLIVSVNMKLSGFAIFYFLASSKFQISFFNLSLQILSFNVFRRPRQWTIRRLKKSWCSRINLTFSNVPVRASQAYATLK